MGGTESKRRVVVEDVNGEGVVQVTEAVVRRMKGLPEAPPAKSSKPKETLEDSKREYAKAVPAEHRQAKDEDRYKEMTKEIEEFYSEKLEDLEKRSKNLQDTSNEQFSKAVKEVEQKFLKYATSPVCQDLQTKVLQCYQKNPDSILDCSSVVNAFTTCVDRARMTVSQNRPLPGTQQVQTVTVS